MGNFMCFKHKQEIFKVVFDYEGQDQDDLKIHKGDRLLVLQKNDTGWWLCRHLATNKIGNVPSNFIIIESANIESQEWWMECGKGEACSLLAMPSNKEGTFLVRQSTEANKFVLSVKLNPSQERCVKHYRIQRSALGEYYLNKGCRFKTVPRLVNHYMSTTDHIGCRLTTPCPRENEEVPLKELEVARSKVKLLTFVGEGSFGEVWKGRYNQRTVAVKKLKENRAELKGNLLNEAQVHNRMRHKRLVNLIGLCLKEEPYLLIMDYMDKGSLNDLLKADKGKMLKFKKLIEIAAQIVEGMLFLEYKGYMHRDLKTSNVLVDSNHLIKISDFGLSKVQHEYAGHSDSIFSVRWSPPEVYEKKEFSIKSDVWAFGVLLFELVTYGELPYVREGVNIRTIGIFISSGKRLQNPSIFHPDGFFKYICPDQLYTVMLQCWREKPHERPPFKQLACFFENYDDD